MADIISRLKLESSEFDSKIKRAVQGLQQMERECHQSGGSLAYLEKEQKQYVQALGQMQTVSTSVRGKINELTQAYTELSSQYRRLSNEEKKGDFGKALSASLDQLKQRIKSSKEELNDINKSLGNTKTQGIDLGSVMQTLGSQFGISTDMMGMMTTGTIAYTAAIGAAATAVAYATKTWAEYNSEIAKQQQVTTVTTGLKGNDAAEMTESARAISKVYGTDFREVINAANTLMTQFGETGDEAMRLIRDGMQGMIMGDGPKLLSMIQQYAPSFRDAGISASQLVAIIHNSEGGIFTDQNMNAIVMGIKNIRLMTNATSTALAKLGIDGNKMSEQLSNGTISIFDALSRVAKAIEQTESGSKEAGEVMQQVFGRQGAMAGTNLGKAIATLNTNLEETKTQTGEIGEGYDELTGAVTRFEEALNKAFGFKGWEEMEAFIKTDFYNTLSDVVEVAGRLKDTFFSTNDFLDEIAKNTAFENMLAGIMAVANPLATVAGLIKQIVDGYNSIHGGSGGANISDGAYIGGMIVPTPKPEGTYTETRQGGKLIRATRDGVDVTDEVLNYQSKIQNIDKHKITRSAPKPTAQKTEEQENSEQIQKLAREFEKASETRRKAIQAEIKALQQRNAEIKYYQELAMGKNVRPMEAKVDTSGLGQTNITTPTLASLQDQLNKPIDTSAIVSPLQALEDELRRIMELQAAAWSPEQFAAYQERIDEITGKIDEFRGIKQISKDWQAASSAIQAVGSAMSQIEDPAAKVMGTIAQAIATIALSYAQTLAKTKGPWEWIAFAATGLATMISTISAIHSATGYAQGGIVDGRGGGFVGGTAYSGDNVGNVRLDSGELVLNKSQQSNLASALDGNPMSSLNLTAVVSGEQILLVANRTTRRQGKGELLTWR